MKKNGLQFYLILSAFPVILLSACTPDISRILQDIDTENTGSMYIYTAPSVRSELAHMRSIRESPEVKSDEVLSGLIDHHTERTAEHISLFARTGGENMIAIKRPPSPCPPPSSCFGNVEYISYFTINPHDRMEILVNSNPVKLENYGYNDLTGIRTVKIPGGLKYESGDKLTVKLNVSYNDEAGNSNRQQLVWDINTTR